MSRVLVTGAAGFIGSHVTRALLARGDEVVGLDDFNAFYDPAIKARNVRDLLDDRAFTLFQGSILDEGVLAAALGAGPLDGVIHLAAWAGVRPSIERPAHYQRENVEGTTVLLEALRACPGPRPRFVFASSSSVYGGNTKVPFSEDDEVLMPVSPYAASKRAGELILWTFHHLYGFPSTALRFFTVYGPGQRPEMAIHKFARLIEDGAPVPMYGDGSTSRDYTFIDDIVKGVLAALDRASGYHIYNLGNASPVRLDELIAKIGHALGKTPRIDRRPPMPGDVEITFADVSRAGRELGYVPSTPLDEGLARFVAWLRAP